MKRLVRPKALGGLLLGAAMVVGQVGAAPKAHAAEPTGTSPSGGLTITIDAPLPGTPVPSKAPVLVTGTAVSAPTPNFIYVIDTSSATGLDCRDLNADGSTETTLDCEIAGLTALNRANLGAEVDVSLVTFDATASVHDIDPVAAGTQAATAPGTDADGNGTPDVVDALQPLHPTGSPADYDSALIAAQSLIVEGELNLVFLLSDGRSEGDRDPTTGPGSPLQALTDAGATISTFAVNPVPGGCAAGEPLSTIAVGGGSCREIDDPEAMGVAVAVNPAVAAARVEVEVNGFFTIAELDPTGQFSALIPDGLLHLGRNDIVARAYGAGGGEVAQAATWVDVKRSRRLPAGGRDRP